MLMSTKLLKLLVSAIFVTKLNLQHLLFGVFSISPLGQTPRSARSDKNVKSIENDDIDEEIEEELSIGEDLLKSDRSLVSNNFVNVCSFTHRAFK